MRLQRLNSVSEQVRMGKTRVSRSRVWRMAQALPKGPK